MKLDRNINKDGKGKYALVRLRGIEKFSPAYELLKKLHELGHVDWGEVGQPDEFFVIKLRDKYSDAALRAYSEAVMEDVSVLDEESAKGLTQYAMQVLGLCERAGTLSDYCKLPD